ncbi:MAG: hypothetical protein R3345_04855 [Fulvivirga sp.]|nr:hypothetical protein [Fulvivirga sp.]
MAQHSLNFEFEARYFTLGELNKSTRNIIFVIHGYGQQAKYFIQKFKGLDHGKNLIVAPEGLSRFYLEGFSGRVGATWMTREDRLTDIKNYINYLNQLAKTIVQPHLVSGNCKVSIIGFSQGSATASRWAANAKVQIDQLVLWAGIFPPDLNYDLAVDKFKHIDVHYVYGLQDPYLNDQRVREMKKISSELEVAPKTTTFEGGHDIDPQTLDKLFR